MNLGERGRFCILLRSLCWRRRRLQMGNALDERLAALRRSRARLHSQLRSNGSCQPNRRVAVRPVSVHSKVTAPCTSRQEISVEASKRCHTFSVCICSNGIRSSITSADENRLGHSRICFNARVCICTGGTDTDTRIHTAAESLSCRPCRITTRRPPLGSRFFWTIAISGPGRSTEEWANFSGKRSSHTSTRRQCQRPARWINGCSIRCR